MNNNKPETVYGINAHPLALVQLKDNWGWYLALGIGMSVLGILAMVFAWASTLFSVIYLGSFLTIAGVFEGIKSFKINKWGSFFLHLLLGVLYVAAGVFIIMNPAQNAVTLTLFLAIFFVISGILKIFFALTRDMINKGWVALNGALSIVLGALVWYQWPVSGVWVIGTFVGIDTLFTGCTWIALSLKARQVASRH